MNRWNKTAGILFFAAASVYPVSALSAAAEKQAKPAKGTEVKLLDETSGPLAAATTQPAGQSVGANQVNVSDAGTVEIHVNDANLVEVLRMLSLQSQKNIIASKEVRGTVTANLYNVTIREALDAILKANGFAYREKGNFIYVYSAKELADLIKAEQQPTTEIFRLYYTPAANAAQMIKPVLSADAQVSQTTAVSGGGVGGSGGAGGSTGSSGSGTTGGYTHATEDVIVVRDYPENIEKVRKIIKEIDRRPQQILVEATIMAARLTNDNNLGVDFTILGGVDFTSILTQQGNIIGATPGATVDAGNRTSSVGSGNNFTKDLNPGFKVGFVSSNVSVFVNALEQVTDTTVLANPKVLTLNKQLGEVLVGREDGYKTTTVTESTAVETVEFLQTGTKLVFRPYIADDGYIRLEVHPEDSDGKVVGGLPTKTTTQVTTNVMVKDGHTVVIGGLFRESSSTARSQVPGLGSIPVVGMLFGNQTDATFREEIIILLTPHIIKDEQRYANASDEQLRDMEKLRVGVRRGMMPWGRERLAEGAYENALAEMNKPKPDRKLALWYLNCATHLNPVFGEAIRMKQSITGRELTSVDNSTVRGFVKRQILAERGAQATATQVPDPTETAEPTDNAVQSPVATTEQPQACLPPKAQPQETASAPTPAPQPRAEARPAVETDNNLLLEQRSETGAGVTVAQPVAPTTQPVVQATKEPETVVTELPQEPVDASEEDDRE